jgi:8-oxo-dGTP pyrophosphatase MutT (NUDIX family)
MNSQNPPLLETKTLKVQVVVFFQPLGAFLRLPENFQILLLRTNQRRGQFWQNITGSIDAIDEGQLLKGAMREVKEETGLYPQDYLGPFKINYETEFLDQWGRNVREFTFFIITQGKNPPPISLDPNEHDTFKWVKVSEIENTETRPFKFPSNQKALAISLDNISKLSVNCSIYD